MAVPDAVAEELARAFLLLERQPKIGASARNRRLRGVRRIHLARIGYYLYYSVDEQADAVDILALWHTSRGEAPNL